MNAVADTRSEIWFSLRKQRWKAEATIDERVYQLGYYRTREQAVAVREAFLRLKSYL